MQYNAIPCNTMHYHASSITADEGYHCPVGSIMAIFKLILLDHFNCQFCSRPNAAKFCHPDNNQKNNSIIVFKIFQNIQMIPNWIGSVIINTGSFQLWCLPLMCISFLTNKESISPPSICHWGTRAFASHWSLGFSSPPGHKLFRPVIKSSWPIWSSLPYGRQGHHELSSAIIHLIWFGLHEGDNHEEYWNISPKSNVSLSLIGREKSSRFLS